MASMVTQGIMSLRPPSGLNQPMRRQSSLDKAARVAPILFAWRVLRPLYWFGLVECAEDGEDLEAASWRKSALFDQFLGFDTGLVRLEGSLR